VDDLLQELPDLGPAPPANGARHADPALDGEEVRMLDALGYDNVTADQLIEHTGMDPAKAAVVLGALEVKGIVRMERGGYIRCPSAAKRAGR
jgi:predicted Rossmann fold nucleotide-binding protein DprA/Smf involved in DNA uptake